MLAASPLTVALVVETCVTCEPFWNTRYETVQLAPGLEAFHDRLTLLLVLLGEVSPVGTLGRTLQVPPAALVVTESAALCAETLPALSRALTVKEYVVLAARPVTVKLVAVGEPTLVPLRNTS